MFRVPRVSVVRFWVIVRAEAMFAVMFAVAPAPLAIALDCQFVFKPQLLLLPVLVQLPDV